MRNFYDILGVRKDASLQEIKAAYRKLSHKFHPDKNDGEEYFTEMFKRMSDAYQTLSNRASREEYDRKLSDFEYNRSTFSSMKNSGNPSSYEKPGATSEKRNISVWDGVNTWRKRRNIMVIVNVLLISMIFGLPDKPGKADAESEAKEETAIKAKVSTSSKSKAKTGHRDVAKEAIASDANEVVPLEAKSEVIQFDNESLDSSSSRNLKIKIIDTVTLSELEGKTRKKGFFKRLFGKKSKDSIVSEN